MLVGELALFADYSGRAILVEIHIRFTLPLYGANAWRINRAVFVNADVGAAKAKAIPKPLQTLRLVTLGAGCMTLLFGCVSLAPNGELAG